MLQYIATFDPLIMISILICRTKIIIIVMYVNKKPCKK